MPHPDQPRPSIELAEQSPCVSHTTARHLPEQKPSICNGHQRCEQATERPVHRTDCLLPLLKCCNVHVVQRSFTECVPGLPVSCWCVEVSLLGCRDGQARGSPWGSFATKLNQRMKAAGQAAESPLPHHRSAGAVLAGSPLSHEGSDVSLHPLCTPTQAIQNLLPTHLNTACREYTWTLSCKVCVLGLLCSPAFWSLPLLPSGCGGERRCMFGMFRGQGVFVTQCLRFCSSWWT